MSTETRFHEAVHLLDAGDEAGLRAHLTAHPDLVHGRIAFDSEPYFRTPCLLEFAAGNPVRHGSLPPNIVSLARVILDAGAKNHADMVNGALELVCSGRVPRECAVQIPLIELLCDYAADPNAAMCAALTHGEFDAVEALIRRGATIDLTVAAATNRIAATRDILPTATPDQRYRGLALAAQHGHVEPVRLLLDAGADPNRYNPIDCHAHSTPLHQAALAGHIDVVRLLVGRGASLAARDTLFHGTPLGWAEHGGRTEVAAYLRDTRGTP